MIITVIYYLIKLTIYYVMIITIIYYLIRLTIYYVDL